MRRLLGKIFWVWCIACVAVCFVGCSSDDDEKEYPPLITDFAVVETGARGAITDVRFDNGVSYNVASQGLNFLVADTLFRCMVAYTLDGDNIRLYNITHLFSVAPKFVTDFGKSEVEDLPRDPVNVISMWRSGGYINMQLGILTTGGKYHSYAFCKDKNGEFTLLHMRPTYDEESYTETLYMSMPIPEEYENAALTFSVNTYDGIYTRTF